MLSVCLGRGRNVTDYIAFRDIYICQFLLWYDILPVSSDCVYHIFMRSDCQYFFQPDKSYFGQGVILLFKYRNQNYLKVFLKSGCLYELKQEKRKHENIHGFLLEPHKAVTLMIHTVVVWPFAPIFLHGSNNFKISCSCKKSIDHYFKHMRLLHYCQ